MKNTLTKHLTLLIISTFISINPAYSDDYSTAHELNSGDVISAEIINEMMQKIEIVSRDVVATDLVGTWNITQTTCINGGPGNCNGGISLDGSTENQDGITRSRSDTITFTRNNNGSYSFSQQNYSSLVRAGAGNTPGSGPYTIINGMAIFENDGDLGKFYIKRISDSRFILSWLASANSSFNIIMLDKIELPPVKPSHLTASIENNSVSLNWNDNSSNETGFKIQRRKEHGSTSIIASISSDTTTFQDELSESGTYFYRVIATNTIGDSLGSNVTRITLTSRERPSVPSSLQAVSDGLNITLTWNDVSNETGYLIYRRSPNSGYRNIGETTENVIGYSDSVSSSGFYSYIVFATNENGRSLPTRPINISVSN